MYIQRMTTGITSKINIVDNFMVLEQMYRVKSHLKVSEQCLGGRVYMELRKSLPRNIHAFNVISDN